MHGVAPHINACLSACTRQDSACFSPCMTYLLGLSTGRRQPAFAPINRPACLSVCPHVSVLVSVCLTSSLPTHLSVCVCTFNSVVCLVTPRSLPCSLHIACMSLCLSPEQRGRAGCTGEYRTPARPAGEATIGEREGKGGRGREVGESGIGKVNLNVS